jgi:hypothetical protein
MNGDFTFFSRDHFAKVDRTRRVWRGKKTSD